MEFLRLLLRFIFRVFIRVTVINPENVPAEGSGIISGNHETMLDMFMIGYRLPRYVKWMAKSELYKFKPLGWLISKWGAYPVKRGQHDTGAVSQTVKYLNAGELVGMFPHGTRSRGRGLSLPAKTGFLRVACAANAPIIPVAIWGKLHIFGRAYVRFGKPVKPDMLVPAGMENDRAFLKEAAQKYMEYVYSLMEIPDSAKKKPEKEAEH